MKRLFTACFATLNIPTGFWLIQNCGVIYKTNTAFIRKNPCIFLRKSTNICEDSKIPSIHQSLMTLLHASHSSRSLLDLAVVLEQQRWE